LLQETVLKTIPPSPRGAAVFALGLGLPLLALAHAGSDGGQHHDAYGALLAGFVHPFTGPDHLAAMLSLGLWSAMTTRRVWLAPLAFAASLTLGAVLGSAGIVLPAVEPMIAASLFVLGLLVATRAHLPLVGGALLAAGFALFHGMAHGAELGGAWHGAAIAGMVAATVLLHGTGIAIARLLTQRSAWTPRLAGSGVALFGAVLLSRIA
jgi:urease accessory protein